MKSRFPFRWRVVVLLFLLSALNYVDRQSLSVLAATMQHALGYSSVQYSYVVASFLAAFTIGFCFSGSLVDRLGVRFIVAAAVIVWSAASILHAFAAGWVGLLCCRFLLGLGESCNTPASLKAIADWIPRRERGLSTAIFSSGFIAGAVLAPPFISFVALSSSWRWAFVATGILGLGYLALWLAQYRAPEDEPRLSPNERETIFAERAAPSAVQSVSLIGALRDPLCLAVAVARFFTDSFSYFFAFWLPAYLQHARGFSLSMIGLFAWIPYLAAGIGGPGGGALSDWLVRRGRRPIDARRRLLLTAACLMPLALAVVRVKSAALAIGLVALLLGAQSCWNSNLLTMITEVFPRERVATYGAATSMAGAIGGIVTTLLVGEIVRFFGYGPVFAGLGLLHLTAFAIIFLPLRRLRGGIRAVPVAHP